MSHVRYSHFQRIVLQEKNSLKRVMLMSFIIQHNSLKIDLDFNKLQPSPLFPSILPASCDPLNFSNCPVNYPIGQSRQTWSLFLRTIFNLSSSDSAITFWIVESDASTGPCDSRGLPNLSRSSKNCLNRSKTYSMHSGSLISASSPTSETLCLPCSPINVFDQNCVGWDID